MLYDMYIDVQGRCQVQLVHLVEEYNETARVPASQAAIEEASTCTSELHKDPFTTTDCSSVTREACVRQAATACRLAYVHALSCRA